MYIIVIVLFGLHASLQHGTMDTHYSTIEACDAAAKMLQAYDGHLTAVCVKK